MSLTEEQKEWIKSASIFDNRAVSRAKELFPEAFEQKPERKSIDVRVEYESKEDFYLGYLHIQEALREYLVKLNKYYISRYENISVTELKSERKRDEDLMLSFLRWYCDKYVIVLTDPDKLSLVIKDFLISDGYKEFLFLI